MLAFGLALVGLERLLGFLVAEDANGILDVVDCDVSGGPAGNLRLGRRSRETVADATDPFALLLRKTTEHQVAFEISQELLLDVFLSLRLFVEFLELFVGVVKLVRENCDRLRVILDVILDDLLLALVEVVELLFRAPLS